MLWPDDLWPQEIGALAVLDGGCLFDPSGRLRIEAVRQRIDARLHLVPRFRQLLHVPRRGLGRPLWVDAAAFDLSDHVQVLPIPGPGDETQLLRVTEELRCRRLDRSRPLWEMWFLPGLPDGRVGLFVKMHHAIADGIAGVAAIGAFLDAVPDAPAGSRQPWTPAPFPPARALFADNVQRHVDGLGRALSTLAHPGFGLRQVRTAWPAVRDLLAEQPPPATSLDRVVGPDRSLAVVRSHLDLVKEVAHRHDAKVNDVLLAATAGGLRELFRSRGEPLDILMPVYVPVTLRQGSRARARGNMIGQMVVPLPLGVSDPGRRLEQIAAETSTRKAESHPSLGVLLRSRIARRALLKVLDRRPVSVTTADVPGPPLPVYLAGARLLEVFPVIPLISRVSLGVGALSYADQFTIMAVADPDACPDLDTFATGVHGALRALTESTSAGPHRR